MTTKIQKSTYIKSLIAGFAFLAYLSAFYPGYLTADSIYMLQMGTGQAPISTWHSPLLVWIWGIFWLVFKTSAAAWLIQIALFISATWFLTSKIKTTWLSCITMFLILLWPPVFTNQAALWKDCWELSLTLIFIGLTLGFFKAPDTKQAIRVIVLAILLVSVRPDYLIVVVPSFILLYFKLRGAVSTGRFKALASFPKLAISIGLVVVFAFLPNSIPGVEKVSSLSGILIYDIEGTKFFSGVGSPNYNCSMVDPLIFGTNPQYSTNLNPIKGVKLWSDPELGLLWWDTLVSHPGPYLLHRLCVAKTFLGMGTVVHYPYPIPEFHDQPFNNISVRSQLNIDLYWLFDSINSGPLWRIWPYILLSTIVTGLLFLWKRSSFEVVLLELTLIMCVFRIAILPATDFRYALWVPVATLILVSFSIESLSQKRVGH